MKRHYLMSANIILFILFILLIIYHISFGLGLLMDPTVSIPLPMSDPLYPNTEKVIFSGDYAYPFFHQANLTFLKPINVFLAQSSVFIYIALLLVPILYINTLIITIINLRNKSIKRVRIILIIMLTTLLFIPIIPFFLYWISTLA